MKNYINFAKVDNYNKNILMTLYNEYQKEILAPDGVKLYLICVIPIEKIKELLISNGFLVEESSLKNYIHFFLLS